MSQPPSATSGGCEREPSLASGFVLARFSALHTARSALCACTRRPLPTPAASSHSCTVISCSTEIEPIYEPKSQKQTNDAKVERASAPMEPPPLAPHKPRLSIFPIFISPEARARNRWLPTESCDRIRSRSRAFFTCCHFIRDPVHTAACSLCV